jgi:hypothetical protein
MKTNFFGYIFCVLDYTIETILNGVKTKNIVYGRVASWSSWLDTVFGVADHEYGTRLTPMLGVRTPLAALGLLVIQNLCLPLKRQCNIYVIFWIL